MHFCVVTIVRNDLAGIKRTHASVLAQTFRDYSWVIVDGASTDGTREYIFDAISIDNVVRISEKDKGIYDAMNKGLSRAKGDYVVFMNAGDVFPAADTLKKVAERLLSSRADFLYGDSQEDFGGTQQLMYKKSRGHNNVSYGMFGCHQSMYYKLSLLEGGSGYDTQYKVSGDYDFTARFLKKAKSIDYFPEPLCNFDLTGVSVQNKLRGRQENWRVQRDVLQLPWHHRAKNRLLYLITSGLMDHAPWLYGWLRFRARA